MKIVINDCFGGFGLSEAGMRAYYGRKGKQVFMAGEGIFAHYFDVPAPSDFVPGDFNYKFEPGWYEAHSLDTRPEDRTDPDLVAAVEELGTLADGRCASLKVVTIPDGVEWTIEEYDGNEHVAEQHRTWY